MFISFQLNVYRLPSQQIAPGTPLENSSHEKTTPNKTKPGKETIRNSKENGEIKEERKKKTRLFRQLDAIKSGTVKG